MFPYNDEENTWISKSAINKKKPSKFNFISSLLFVLLAALLSTTIPSLIYFLRVDLF